MIAFAGSISFLKLVSVYGQEAKVRRVGVLTANEKYLPDYDAFRDELQHLGLIEGKTLSIQWRFAAQGPSQLPKLAKELVSFNPEVLVAISTPAVNALRPVAGEIPIVFSNIGDPLGTGFVASLAHPGGNMTGQSILAPELSAKRLALMKDLIPSTGDIAVIWNPTNPANDLQFRQVRESAAALALHLTSLPVQKEADIDGAVGMAAKQRAGALLVLPDPVTGSHRSKLITLVAKANIAAMYGYREFPDAGGLMSYGPNLRAMYRRTAIYVDKILKGAKPADLPVEQPATFEFVINQRAAKALGLTIPERVLLRADEVVDRPAN